MGEIKKTTINLPSSYLDLLSRMAGTLTDNIREALEWLICVRRGGFIQIMTRHGLSQTARQITTAHILEGAEIVFQDADGYYSGTLRFDVATKKIIVSAERQGMVVGANISLPLVVQWIAKNDPDFFERKGEK